MRFEIHQIEVNGASVPLRCYIPDIMENSVLKNERSAVIVFPGGGYAHLCPREAEPIALSYVSEGFCGFVLDYSVYPARFPQALLEGLTAVRFVREHAEEYGISPDHISVCGFSAGGHLAASVGTLWKHSCIDGMLDGERALYRPDSMVLCYPVINPLHRGSFLNLFSQNEEELTPEIIEMLSLENQVDEDTPPAFIWHNADDFGVPSECSLVFALALHHVKVPYELRVWESGGHGCALASGVTEGDRDPLPCSAWVKDSVEFLRRR